MIMSTAQLIMWRHGIPRKLFLFPDRFIGDPFLLWAEAAQ